MSDGSQANLGHGARLSEREYEQRIVALHSGLPSRPGAGQETALSRRELDLTIDYRLGQNFPQERRDALWAIQQQVEKKRHRLIFLWLLHFISYKWLYGRANKLAGYLVDEYAKVLSPQELQAYFDLHEKERPQLPFDKF